MAYQDIWGYTAAGGNPFYYDLNRGIAETMYGGGAGAATTTAPAAASSGLTGAAARGYTDASGGVPAMPSPQDTQKTAIGGNLAALPDLQKMAGNVNAFNLGEVTKQYEAGIHNYNAMTQQSSRNIGSALAGQVPADVLVQLQQGAAQRGIATGAPGGPNANAAYLRALGLTSLGQQQYGEKALTEAVGRMPRVGLYDLSQGFVTPAQQQSAQYMANVLAASPIPQAAYNQAMAAAMAGQNRGYGSARQAVPGGGGSNFLTDIMNRYNPFGSTATGSTGAPPAATSPGVPTGVNDYYDWQPTIENGQEYLYTDAGLAENQDYWDALSGTGIYE